MSSRNTARTRAQRREVLGVTAHAASHEADASTLVAVSFHKPEPMLKGGACTQGRCTKSSGGKHVRRGEDNPAVQPRERFLGRSGHTRCASQLHCYGTSTGVGLGPTRAAGRRRQSHVSQERPRLQQRGVGARGRSSLRAGAWQGRAGVPGVLRRRAGPPWSDQEPARRARPPRTRAAALGR